MELYPETYSDIEGKIIPACLPDPKVETEFNVKTRHIGNHNLLTTISKDNEDLDNTEQGKYIVQSSDRPVWVFALIPDQILL